MNQNYIKVNAESNPNIHMLQKYASRFGYVKKDTNSMEDFVIRLNNRLDYLFENEDDYKYARQYITLPVLNILGKPYHMEEDYILYNGSFLHRVLQNLGKNHELVPILIICEMVIDYLIHENEDDGYCSSDEQNNIIKWFVNAIAEDLLISNINVALYKTPDGYEFYPVTEPMFDDVLIADMLNWLSEYPKSKEQYDKALKMILQQSEPRDVIDNLRLTFELFIKEFFNNKKSLENQKVLIGNYLTAHNVSKQFTNMYTTLFTYYTTYNNDEAKHNNTADEQEIDFLVYLTGSFMRFLIQLKRNEKKI